MFPRSFEAIPNEGIFSLPVASYLGSQSSMKYTDYIKQSNFLNDYNPLISSIVTAVLFYIICIILAAPGIRVACNRPVETTSPSNENIPSFGIASKQ